MTPQEALAQALHEAGIRCQPNIPSCRGVKSHMGHAAAILAALPEGWVLRGPEEHEQLRLLVDAYERKGAQQERERLLRRHMAVSHGGALQVTANSCPNCYIFDPDEETP